MEIEIIDTLNVKAATTQLPKYRAFILKKYLIKSPTPDKKILIEAELVSTIPFHIYLINEMTKNKDNSYLMQLDESSQIFTPIAVYEPKDYTPSFTKDSIILTSIVKNVVKNILLL